MKSFSIALQPGWLWRLAGIASLVLTAGLVAFAPFPGRNAAPTERHFRIEASCFQFTPAVLRVNPGDRVSLELVAEDVVHGLSIDGYAVKLVADPGQTARATFVADRPGVFRFRCSMTCGNLHPFMLGKFQVGSNELFWRAAALSVITAVLALWGWRR